MNGKPSITRYAGMAAALCLLAPLAFAQSPRYGESPGNAPKPEFMEADSNGDHAVTFIELAAKRDALTESQFAALDTNGDLVLTSADRPREGRMNQRGGPGAFRGGGPGDRQGPPPGAPGGRGQFDRPQDGRGPQGFEQPGGFGRRGGGPGGGADMPGGPAAFLSKADMNRDGKVTRDELKTAMPQVIEALFAEMDHNRDGAISSMEMMPPPGMGGPGGQGPQGFRGQQGQRGFGGQQGPQGFRGQHGQQGFHGPQGGPPPQGGPGGGFHQPPRP